MSPRILAHIVFALLVLIAAPLSASAQPSPATAPASQPAGEVPSWLSGAVRTGGVTPESRRDCVICHLDWSDSFSRPGAVLLIDKPVGPVVTRPETCLGCHDAGVGDARRRVWQEHGHKTGVAPPPGMQVSDVLPLENGQIACRTCHSAHGGLGPQTIATIVFLRVQNDRSQLCMMCHTDQAKGPAGGMHWLGKMNEPVPPQILGAGGKAGPADFAVICQSCHTAHGVQEQHLQILPTDNNALCAPCHVKMTPGAFRSQADMPHPQNPPLKTPAQHQAIKEMGTVIGVDDRLICLSCHKVHKALPDSYILAETLEGSRLCIRCHPELEGTVAGTPHDLRKTAPQSHNQRNQTPAQSGPCGTCHGFHSFVRSPDPRAGDPTGLCTSCHQQDGVAAKHTGLPLSHPSAVTAADIHGQGGLPLYPPRGQTRPRMLACLTCHEPHQPGQGNYLRAHKDVLCADCHTDQAKNLPAAHDFTDKPDLKNARNESAQQSGKCGFCHAVHNANGPMMWSALKESPQNPDQLCTLCHQQNGMGGAKPLSRFVHPTGSAALGEKATIPAALPLFDPQGHVARTGAVACGSCHDPHAGKGSVPKPASTGATGNPKGATGGLPASAATSMLRTGATGNPEGATANPEGTTGNLQGATGGLPASAVRTGATGGLPASAVTGSSSASAATSMLRGGLSPAGLCVQCHTAQAKLAEGPHDPGVRPANWPKETQGNDLCMACHKVHSNDPVRQLWTVAPAAEAVDPADGICVACHAPANWARSTGQVSIGQMMHPRMVRGLAPVPNLPLAPATQGSTEAALECRTCHDPHSKRADWHLLRQTEVKQANGVCFSCHPNASFIDQSLHAPWLAPSLRSDTQACGPCHAVHAVKGSMRQDLWAGGLNPAGADLAAQECLSCHGPAGPGKTVNVVTHPDVLMAWLLSLQNVGGVPLQQITSQGHISCITCHLPHGRPTVALTGSAATQPTLAALRATKPMLRSNISADLCSTCHGFNAARLYLYFHRPSMRPKIFPTLPTPAQPGS